LGFAFPLEYLEELARRCAGVLVIDEAYVDFAEFSALELVKKYANVVVTRTFSKSYSLAGMRLGLAVARPAIVAALDKIRDHYHLDRLALVAATAALGDQQYLAATVAKIRGTRARFVAGLHELGYTVIPSQANFVFASPPDRNGKRIYDALHARQILVRYFADPILAHGMRITIGTDAEMEATLDALRDIG
jgi:histidinol-phosphate aminotransferase